MTRSAIETGVLYRGDNLERLADLPSEAVDLIYLDPPFFSNRFYEVIWGDEAEVRSFEDRWEGGIQHYIDWMRERVTEMHRVLKPTGSFYLHCDPHASHYLKVMLDGIFGQTMFRNEVIWKRTSAHSSAKRYGPVHDTILYYGRGPRITWNDLRTDYEAAYLDRYYKFDDGDGRLYWRADLTGAGIRKGATGQPWRGLDPSAKGRHWMVPPEELDAFNAAGRIYWPLGGTGWPQHKRYRDELKGKALDDVWTDIDRINPQARERRGYPTQKPEALLHRIIASSSNAGDIVLDPFCGCGTSVAVAEQLARQWIGIDISQTAMDIMRWRLDQVTHGKWVPNIVGAPETVDDLRTMKPFEFQNYVIGAMHGSHSPKKTGDMGIDGFSFLEKRPIQVKRSDHVGRNVVDNFETAIRRAGHDSGFIVALSFTKGAYEEVARAKSEGLSVTLVKAAEILLLKTRPGRPPAKLGPQPAADAEPAPEVRKRSELPAAERLVESEREAGVA